MNEVLKYFSERKLFDEVKLLKENEVFVESIASQIKALNKDEFSRVKLNNSYKRMLVHLVSESLGYYSWTKTIPLDDFPEKCSYSISDCKLCIEHAYQCGDNEVIIAKFNEMSKRKRGQKLNIYYQRKGRVPKQLKNKKYICPKI